MQYTNAVDRCRLAVQGSVLSAEKETDDRVRPCRPTRQYSRSQSRYDVTALSHCLCLSVCLCVRFIIIYNVCLSACLSVCLSVSVSVCLSVCLSLSLSLSLSLY